MAEISAARRHAKIAAAERFRALVVASEPELSDGLPSQESAHLPKGVRLGRPKHNDVLRVE
jgi:hypothetical protein